MAALVRQGGPAGDGRDALCGAGRQAAARVSGAGRRADAGRARGAGGQRQRRSRRCTPISWCMTTCPAWMMTTCGAASRRFTRNGTRRRRCWRAMPCRRWPLNCWRSGAGVGRGADGAGCRAGAGLGHRRDGAGPGAGHRGRNRRRALTLDQITALQAGKTGALIGFAAEAGAVIAGADRAPLRRYATALGLAFQIADDILDVTATRPRPASGCARMRAAGKATFVSLLGLDGGEGTGGGAGG